MASLFFKQPIVVVDTTDTDSITTGSLLLNGGLGVSKTAFISSLNVVQDTQLNGHVSVGSSLMVNGPELKIPTGDTLSRPSNPQEGYIRYNTEFSQFEGYGPGSAWGSLGGVVDIAQTTKILASASPSVTDGNLYFYTVGDERMRINSSGNIGIGTTAPSATLDVNGNANISNATIGSLSINDVTGLIVLKLVLVIKS